MDKIGCGVLIFLFFICITGNWKFFVLFIISIVAAGLMSLWIHEWFRRKRSRSVNNKINTEQKNNLTDKEIARQQKLEKYLSLKAIGIYFAVVGVLIVAILFIFIDKLPLWSEYLIYLAGFFWNLAFFVLYEDWNNGLGSFNSSSSYSTRQNPPQRNNKTLFGSNTSRKSSKNNSPFEYNDDYERGNRKIWKNKWDHEAWNDHEDSCEHDDPWDCDD